MLHKNDAQLRTMTDIWTIDGGQKDALLRRAKHKKTINADIITKLSSSEFSPK